MTGSPRSSPPLSSREAQVLHMAALGLGNGDIAHELDVSVHAVKFHLASIYRKLGVSNRTEAAVVFTRDRAVARAEEAEA